MTIAVSGAPRLLIVAGPNGSGKTTLTNRLRAMGLDFGEYINADEIALTLPKTDSRDRLAQMEADRRRAVALGEQRSFSFETVMSHPSKIDDMRLAKAAGYHFTFVGVALQDPLLNVERVALRVREGGHDVPTDRIISRYARTLTLMPSAIALADRSLIFDNSDSEKGPMLVMTAEQSSAEPQPKLAVRIASTVAINNRHWLMRNIIAGLNRLRNDKQIKMTVRWDFKS